MRERLYRSRSDRMIFGVAGGMARWLDIDPAVVRLVWALLIIAGGVGLLLYIVAAIVVPEEPVGAMPTPGTAGAPASGEPGATGWAGPGRTHRHDSGTAPIIIGIVLVLLGAWFLAERYIDWLDNALLWPALLIVVGILLLVGAMRRTGGPPAA